MTTPLTLARPEIPPLTKVRHVHMIAICGTGMGSLAGMLKSAGLKVTGSDQNAYPPMSTQLRGQGIEIREGYRAENLDDAPDLVVVGNAVSKTNPEVEALLARGIPFVSFPEALEHFFLASRMPVVIAGTHGKTTTTSLTAWVLDQCGLDPGFMIGGVAKNFGRNDRVGSGKPFAVEGDEYDSAFFDKEPKFLHYRPHVGVLTSVEFDHGDIYKSFDILVEKFAKFVALPPSDGLLIACTDYDAITKLLPGAKAPVVTYGLTGSPDFTAKKIEGTPDGGTAFTVERKGKPARTWRMSMTGRHNVLNALSVLAVAEYLGLPEDKVQAAFDSFQGITRRQDLVGTARGVSVYDDFAHHPTAIAETIAAIRMRHPGKRIIALFEPRSNTSRRNIFQKEFPPAFAEADFSLIAPVFNAEKLSDEERLDVAKVVADIRALGKEAENPDGVDAIVARVAALAREGDVVLVMSNGGFGGIHGKILQALQG
jgi:UDP-N-acetylmuramate: L-alanyl-gamma-D-glutamyl-meso-diaminopimelate ligase